MKLLIVDDIPQNRRLLRAQLELESVEVLEAANGIEALRQLESHSVDGVVSDILMPEMDGFRLCLELRRDPRMARLPFVLYTSTYNSPSDRVLAGHVGADAYLTKPATTASILAALAAAAGSRQPGAVAPDPSIDEGYVLKQYNEALVHKLEEKNTELQVSEAFYRTTLDALSSRIAILDEHGVIVAVNQAWRRFAQRSVAEAATPSEGDNYLAACEAAAASGDPVAREILDGIRGMLAGLRGQLALEYARPLSDVTHWTMARFSLFQGASRARIVAAHEDITELKRAEEQVRLANQELEQRVALRTVELLEANRELAMVNRELESFANFASHDLRAPLRAIDGYTELLETRHAQALPAEAQRYLGLVRLGTRRMSALIDDLMAFARTAVQPLDRTTVDLDKLVRGSLAEEFTDLVVARSVDVRIGALPVLQADEALLRRVISNLLGNAFKYTTHQPRPLVEIGSETLEGIDVVFVRDNGVGFNMAQADRLFAAFQRLHRQDEYEGSGVGLALVQRIVARHGGRIWAESAPGLGATFRFTLERAAGGAGAAADRLR
jgi:signal transduction histidine kinase/CheY-like chemotaxis protein